MIGATQREMAFLIRTPMSLSSPERPPRRRSSKRNAESRLGDAHKQGLHPHDHLSNPKRESEGSCSPTTSKGCCRDVVNCRGGYGIESVERSAAAYLCRGL